MLDYLNQTLGLSATITPWEEAKKFPLYLRSGKEYFLMCVGGAECILIEADENDFNLAVFRKQWATLAARPEYIVLCFKHLNPRRRKTLIEAQQSFIVPGSQVYLPFLGVVLQERMRLEKNAPKKFSPGSQMTLLYLLYDPAVQPIRQVDLAKKLNISTMNVTRAIQELTALELVHTKKEGRCDYVSAVAEGKELYEKAFPHMTDPVIRKVYVQTGTDVDGAPFAGESALSKHCVYDSPKVGCRAISQKEYKQLEAEGKIAPAETSGQDCVQLEIWRYDPKTLADGDSVDTISLALSLRDVVDDRIELAVGQMMAFG